MIYFYILVCTLVVWATSKFIRSLSRWWINCPGVGDKIIVLLGREGQYLSGKELREKLKLDGMETGFFGFHYVCGSLERACSVLGVCQWSGFTFERRYRIADAYAQNAWNEWCSAKPGRY